MTALARALAVVAAVAVTAALGGRLAAQTGLAQLGLAEAAARTFVLDEIKSPATGRRDDIAIAGTRAFLKLPPAARAAAATGLFAWARAYVDSPAFKASYEAHRRDRIPPSRQYALSVDEAVRRETEELLAGMEQMRQELGVLPPADQQKVLEKLNEAQAMVTSPEMIQARRTAIEAARADEGGSTAEQIREVDERTPADPQILFARRLREFLEVTADVNFSARTINLTGGTDGIEFVDRADRQRHWMWQEAALAGPEATAAARTAAQAWLKEIQP
jgi:hypothetical protein